MTPLKLPSPCLSAFPSVKQFDLQLELEKENFLLPPSHKTIDSQFKSLSENQIKHPFQSPLILYKVSSSNGKTTSPGLKRKFTFEENLPVLMKKLDILQK